jgi:hypothetical protein
MATASIEAAGLTFDADAHVYRFNGAVIPNVTRVLEEEGLVSFAGVPDATLRDSQWRGSAVHHACLLDDEGDLDESTVEPEHRGYLEAWRKCKANLRPKILAAEVRLYSGSYRYAGTPDRVVILPDRQRRPQVWDLKTGTLQRAARLQTSAYAHLLAGRMIGGETLGAHGYDRFAVRLTKEGHYIMQEHPLRDLSDDFGTFYAALRVSWWKKQENCR